MMWNEGIRIVKVTHHSAEKGVVLSYRSRTEEARRMTAAKKQKQRMKSLPDKTSQYGPPDRADNFLTSATTSRKRGTELSHSICIDKSVVECIPNSHPEILGKCARMRFDNEEGQEEWYEGVYTFLVMD